MRSMHLTRATVHVGRPPGNERGASREYLLHQAIADLFGDRDGRGYLWRELGGSQDEAELLLLSEERPDPLAGNRMPPHRRLISLATREFRPELSAGQLLDFELRVNATRVVTTPSENDLMDVGGAPRKSRHDVWDLVFASRPSEDVRMIDVYSTWLQTQLGDAARIGQVAVTERRLLHVRRSLGARTIPIVACNLVGELTIQNPDSLVTRMGGGIGRARAFGCGLLCLARHGSRPRRPVAVDIGTA